MPSRSNCSPWPRRLATRPTSACCSGSTKVIPRAAAAGAAGAADAVDVALVVLGRVEVDHVRDVREVEAAGRDVGGDERLHARRCGTAPSARSRWPWRHVAVQRRGGHFTRVELAGEPVGAALRPDEDESQAAVALELLDQPVELAVGVTETKVCSTSPCSSPFGQLGLEAGGVARVGAGELADLAVERGREEHRLAVGRQPADDLVHLRLEAHVEHPVGLVEDERPDALERDQPALDQILEAAGRGDEDVSATRALGLARDRRAAVDGRHPELLRAADQLELARDLRAELARRDEDQHRRLAVGGGDPLDDRQAEGKGLAGPGRRLRQHVEAGERVREDERLDREGSGDVALLERIRDFGAHAERSAERNVLHRLFDSLLGVRDKPLETPEGGTRSCISRDGPLPSVVSE